VTDQTTPQPLTPEIVTAIVRDMDDPRYPTRITVYCDHCGVQNTGEYLVREDMTSRERLAVARRYLVETEGWEHTADGDDFCPAHAAPAAEETHVVVDSSDDPEHADDCSGCETAEAQQ